MYSFSINCEGNAVAQLRKIDEALQQAGVNAKVQVGHIESSFAGMGEKIKSVMSEIKDALIGAFVGYEGFEFFRNAKEQFDQLEDAQAQLKAGLESTNHAAGLTYNDLENSMMKFTKQVVYSRAEISDLQSQLLTFPAVTEATFDKTTMGVMDMATRLHRPLEDVAIMLGKALQDPETGVSMLRRAGVNTDELKVKLENTNSLLEKQKLILQEINTEFAGSAKAAAGTDEGRIKMAIKSWDDFKLELGEDISKLEISLLPLLATIRDDIKGAFESAPVQFFVNHMKDLLTIALKLVPIWVTYKGLMLANTLLTTQWSLSTQGLSISMGAAATTTGEAAAAAESFSLAWSSVGIGAIAVGLGLVVEHIISMNAELDKAIDKKFRLSENRDFFKSQAEKYNSIKERLGELNNPEFGLKEKQELYHDIQSYLHDVRLKKSELDHAVVDLHANKPVMSGGFKHFIGVDMLRSLTDSTYQAGLKSREAFKEQSQSLHQLDQTIPELKDVLKTLAQKGIKPSKGYRSDSGEYNLAKQNAYDTAALAGPSGGLGSQKTIIINFHDALQKVNVADGRGVVQSGKEAIEFMISAMQNFAFAQSSTQ